MDDILIFEDRDAFRAWLDANCGQKEGVWLLFGKKGGPKTLAAAEALEEALCFGWIDGQMQSIDSRSYKKYFSARRAKSNWSEKNKALAEQLCKQGKMTAHGLSRMDEAKQNGQWDAPKKADITDEHIAVLSALLRGREPAHTNFESMPASVKKTYTRAYLDAKTDKGRESRFQWRPFQKLCKPPKGCRIENIPTEVFKSGKKNNDRRRKSKERSVQGVFEGTPHP